MSYEIPPPRSVRKNTGSYGQRLVHRISRGRDVILCSEQSFPNGGEFVLRLSDHAMDALQKELAALMTDYNEAIDGNSI